MRIDDTPGWLNASELSTPVARLLDGEVSSVDDCSSEQLTKGDRVPPNLRRRGGTMAAAWRSQQLAVIGLFSSSPEKHGQTGLRP